LFTVAAATHGKLSMALDVMVVSRIFASWNQLDGWLRQVDELRSVA
jgi:hypothetical protein